MNQFIAATELSAADVAGKTREIYDTMLRKSGHFESANFSDEEVIGCDRRQCRKKADCRREERFGNPRCDDSKARGATRCSSIATGPATSS